MPDHWSKFVQWCLVFGPNLKVANVEKLKVTIRPTGDVKVSAEGVTGDRCRSVTAGMEAALGAVVSDQPTEEMYESVSHENVTGH